MNRQYTPDEITQLPATPSNRGLLHALARFGDPAAQKAARAQLAAWTATPTTESAA